MGLRLSLVVFPGIPAIQESVYQSWHRIIHEGFDLNPDQGFREQGGLCPAAYMDDKEPYKELLMCKDMRHVKTVRRYLQSVWNIICLIVYVLH